VNNGAPNLTEGLLTLTVVLQAMIAVRRTWMISVLLAMLTDARLMIVVSLLIMTVVRCQKRVALGSLPLKTYPPKNLT
jgi:hypothetical protein